METSTSLFIDNQWSMGAGELFSSLNPANHEVLWQGHAAIPSDIELAIPSDLRAQKSWGDLAFTDRCRYALAFAEALQANHQKLATAIAEETGRTLWECLAEVNTMINKVAISIEAYQVRCAEMVKSHGEVTTSTRHRPHGVLAVFGPFNFPGHLPNGHIVPALLAGNAIIFKPSELTPHVGELMVNLWHSIGLPSGTLNLVQGGRSTGQYLAQHPKLNGLLFTGSWNTGQKLAEQYAPHTGKILALEMGGNNPLVVWNPQDIEAAAYHTIQSAYMTSGQRCTCARRLIVPNDERGEHFLQVLTKMVNQIVVGAFDDTPEPYMGPLISDRAAATLLAAENQLRTLGGSSLVSMQQLPRGQAFVTPGIIDMTKASAPADEEFFGPLLQVYRVDNFDQAIEVANRTDYGLVAGLIGGTPEEYKHFFQHVKAGVINWNLPTTGATSYAPFGGLGKSGNLRPSAYYAADYCAYPVASSETAQLTMPASPTPGIFPSS